MNYFLRFRVTCASPPEDVLPFNSYQAVEASQAISLFCVVLMYVCLFQWLEKLFSVILNVCMHTVLALQQINWDVSAARLKR